MIESGQKSWLFPTFLIFLYLFFFLLFFSSFLFLLSSCVSSSSSSSSSIRGSYLSGRTEKQTSLDVCFFFLQEDFALRRSQALLQPADRKYLNPEELFILSALVVLLERCLSPEQQLEFDLLMLFDAEPQSPVTLGLCDSEAQSHRTLRLSVTESQDSEAQSHRVTGL
ncbi:hypothetical protein F7725_008824 [Dissostichus mawsoni]|uniref:Uncharacterized protein n=1 Tax=Dissostichus mawsoni TaxID=36200 RepID=A0A7J5Z5C0_DISMA|nr:hypothetical protein F7725_008824 [Dissostichus mawsoni]